MSRWDHSKRSVWRRDAMRTYARARAADERYSTVSRLGWSRRQSSSRPRASPRSVTGTSTSQAAGFLGDRELLGEQDLLVHRTGEGERLDALVAPVLLVLLDRDVGQPDVGVPAQVRDEQTDVAGVNHVAQLTGEHVHRVDGCGGFDRFQQPAHVEPRIVVRGHRGNVNEAPRCAVSRVRTMSWSVQSRDDSRRIPVLHVVRSIAETAAGCRPNRGLSPGARCR